MVKIAGFFYFGMAALALFLNAVRGAPLVPLAWGPSSLLAFGWALAGAAATIGFSRYAEARFAWAERMRRWFRKKLGPLTGREVISLALASGVAEELLFRGCLQPAFGDMLGSPVAGWLLATLAFGFLHVGGKAMWPWTAFALVLGGGLGWLQLYGQNVLAPILLHVLVNAVNLRRLAAPAFSRPEPASWSR